MSVATRVQKKSSAADDTVGLAVILMGTSENPNEGTSWEESMVQTDKNSEILKGCVK